MKRDFIINTVDIMPSLLSMMGLPVPKETEGTDLSACIAGEADTEEGALMMCTGPTAIFGDGNEWRAYRTKQYTYAIFKSDGQEFLFDDKNDPYQMENLIDNKSYRETAEELKSKMYAKMNEIGDTFENNTWYEKHWVENRIIKRTAALKDF